VDISIYFARFFGLYFLAFAALWVVFKDQFAVSLREIIKSRSLIFFSGVISLIFGIAVVVAHPSWNWNWDVAITIIGYFAIFQGIIRCGFVDHVQRVASDLLENKHWFLVIFLFVVGAYLAYHGFIAH
jgi:hypothetical protein